ncbi:MAG: RtcB family protein [Planctomycetes bacterium]|nr:RtcB family protein [Planctomycetota bacterium]
MRVDGIIFASQRLMADIRHDPALEQVANVATLPGIVGASLAMPDIHWGYGFCIGGVAATDIDDGGVVSPGGVGYDINCGVRLLRTSLAADEVRPRLKELIDQLFRDVPAGVGVGGPFVYDHDTLVEFCARGTPALAQRGLARQADLEATEAGGCIPDADPDAVSDVAYRRGRDQCGTLGSGNHFMEVQQVQTIFDPKAADVLGLSEGTVTVMIHSGSRGLGYQVCDDALRRLRNVPAKYGYTLSDRQLVCAPVDSPEGREYLGAMRAAANFAWCNRQLLATQARATFERFFDASPEALDMRQIYDVAHNVAKIETYTVGGRQRRLCVHRKGATRAFGPGHPELPGMYREMGQPVIIPGDMGTASYLLLGTAAAMEQSWGSTCHGAGRVLSRKAAVRAARGRRIDQELRAKGIFARAHGRAGLAEEQPDAYKDIDAVVGVVRDAGLSRVVARLTPLGVVKG